MAKLSKRAGYCKREIPEECSLGKENNSTSEGSLIIDPATLDGEVTRDLHKGTPAREKNFFKNLMKGENNMNELRTVNITLVDNNSNLDGKDRIVFSETNFLTEYSDEDTKTNIIATGKVMEALEKHNKVREGTANRDYLGAAREVFLLPIKLLSDTQLTWRIVTVG